MEPLEDRRMLSVAPFDYGGAKAGGERLNWTTARNDSPEALSDAALGHSDGPAGIHQGAHAIAFAAAASADPSGTEAPTIPADTTPAGESYFVFEDWPRGNSWCDAEKSPSDTDDDALCWAAAASNILAWGGWGTEAYNTCDEIFAQIQDRSTDVAALPGAAWRWWFEGGPIGPMDAGGGGYFPEYDLDAWDGTGISGSGLPADIHYLFQAGYGVTLMLGGPGAHAVTCWGLNYDPETGDYLGVWITDSDDAKGSDDPPDQLRYFETAYTGSNWYLRDYYGSDSWYIAQAYALSGNPDTLTSAPNGVIEGTVFCSLDEDGLADAGESGLADVSVLLDVNGNGLHDERSESFRTSEAVAVVDKAYVTSTLDVATEITSITDLNLTLDISHSYNSDLTAWLIAPGGTKTALFVGIGGSGDDFTNVTFDDEAAASAREVCSGTVTGTLRPFYSLSEFDAIDPNGRWTLKLYDRYGGDTGTLNGWSLEISESERVATTDARGSFSFDALPAGDYTLIATAATETRSAAAAEVVHDITLAGGETRTVNIGFNGGECETLGDLNADGFVGSIDLDIVRANWDRRVPAGTLSDGDPSQDGQVGGDDLDIVRANWGTGILPASAATSSGDAGTTPEEIYGPRRAPDACPTDATRTGAAFENGNPAEAAWQDALDMLEFRLRMKTQTARRW